MRLFYVCDSQSRLKVQNLMFPAVRWSCFSLCQMVPCIWRLNACAVQNTQQIDIHDGYSSQVTKNNRSTVVLNVQNFICSVAGGLVISVVEFWVECGGSVTALAEHPYGTHVYHHGLVVKNFKQTWPHAWATTVITTYQGILMWSEKVVAGWHRMCWGHRRKPQKLRTQQEKTT